MKEQLKRHPYRTAFVLHLAASVFAFILLIVLHKGQFSLAGDFNVQQIPFAMHGNSMIRDIGYLRTLGAFDFSLDLGSGYLGGMAFYILGNPSFYLSLLFPPEAMIYLIGWLYMLKYTLAGLFAFAYLRRHVERDESALIASFFYAFSGFSAEALLFYHFHDVVWAFPLLLIAFDKLMEEKKRGLFALACALNFVICYYFLFGEIIVLLLYFAVRYAKRNMETLKKIGAAAFEGALGIGLIAAIFLPAFLFVRENPRIEVGYYGHNALLFSSERYLFILKGILLPGEVMSDQSAVISSNFATCSLYMPLVGLILVIAFFFTFRKHWLKKLLIILTVFALVPILNSSFGLFAGLYHRWYYMFLLFFALASAIVIDRWLFEEKALLGSSPIVRTIQKSALIYGLVAAAFVIFLMQVPWNEEGDSKIYRMDLFTAGVAICFAGILLTWFLFCLNRKRKVRMLLIFVMIFSFGTTMLTAFEYQGASSNDAKTLADRLSTSASFAEAIGEDPGLSYVESVVPYRFTKRENPELLTNDYMTTGTFCSTVQGSIFRFFESLGQERAVKNPDPIDGYDELVSGRYRFATTKSEDEEAIAVIEGKAQTYYLYENENVPPIGFTYDTYMTASDFYEEPDDKKAMMMLKTLVIPDEAEEEVAVYLRKHDPYYDGSADRATLPGIVRDHLDEASESFYRNDNSFRSVITADKAKYAFYSIPNDRGWTATVNGTETQILDVNGMMAVLLQAGRNEVEFTYTVPGLHTGYLISLASAAVFALYLIASRLRKRAP